jgi:hypothetical protein
VGGKAREGHKEIERILPDIYTISGGESQRGGGPADRIRIKRSGFKSSGVRIWGDSLRDSGTPPSCRRVVEIITVWEVFISQAVGVRIVAWPFDR